MKAILVVDIPEEIYNELIDKEYMVDIMTKRYERVYFDTKLKLKSIPQKEIVRGFDRYEEGWNDCIDEMLGGITD